MFMPNHTSVTTAIASGVTTLCAHACTRARRGVRTRASAFCAWACGSVRTTRARCLCTGWRIRRSTSRTAPARTSSTAGRCTRRRIGSLCVCGAGVCACVRACTRAHVCLRVGASVRARLCVCVAVRECVWRPSVPLHAPDAHAKNSSPPGNEEPLYPRAVAVPVTRRSVEPLAAVAVEAQYPAAGYGAADLPCHGDTPAWAATGTRRPGLPQGHASVGCHGDTPAWAAT